MNDCITRQDVTVAALNQLTVQDKKEKNIMQWIRDAGVPDNLDLARLPDYELELPELGSIWARKLPPYPTYKVIGTTITDNLNGWVIALLGTDGQQIWYNRRCEFYNHYCPLLTYSQHTGITRKQFDYSNDQVCQYIRDLFFGAENANQKKKQRRPPRANAR